MPTIACPGCGKKYNVPETAAGQVAQCKCGKRFRLGAAPKSSSAGASPPAKAAPVAAVRVSATKTATAKRDDDFWDDALKEEVAAKPLPISRPAPIPAPGAGASAAIASLDVKAKEAPKKRRKKRIGIRWGFDWGKVAGGGLTFLVAGGFTLVLVVTTGRLYFWPAGIAVVGLFTCLSGLMGEEGIW